MDWINVAMFVVTAASAGISYLLFRSQVEPDVVVYADIDRARSHMVTLVIANIGKGVAKKISFASSEPIPEAVIPQRRFIDSGPLIHGIPALGPGATRVVFWGNVDELIKTLDRRVIRVVATYESDDRGPWSGASLTRESLIEVGSFNGTAIPENSAGRAASSLEEIARLMRDEAEIQRIRDSQKRT